LTFGVLRGGLPLVAAKRGRSRLCDSLRRVFLDAAWIGRFFGAVRGSFVAVPVSLDRRLHSFRDRTSLLFSPARRGPRVPSLAFFCLGIQPCSDEILWTVPPTRPCSFCPALGLLTPTACPMGPFPDALVFTRDPSPVSFAPLFKKCGVVAPPPPVSWWHCFHSTF